MEETDSVSVPVPSAEADPKRIVPPLLLSVVPPEYVLAPLKKIFPELPVLSTTNPLVPLITPLKIKSPLALLVKFKATPLGLLLVMLALITPP